MSPNRQRVYGYFHPYCNAGGGGERVLWQAAYDTLRNDSNCSIVVYTGDLDVTKQEILKNVTKRFDIVLDPERVDFIFLNKRYLVDSNTWPVLTLLGQAVGSVILTFEAISKYKPDVWIDTMGYPFSYPLVSLWLNIPILAYVHFPIISKDMLAKLQISYTSVFGIKQLVKYIYWQIFMILYTFVGYFVDITLTNSTWTYNHVKSIWKFSEDISILYPPCSTEKFIAPKDLDSTSWDRKNQIIVLAQFRPEKRHGLIIEQYSKFLKDPSVQSPPKLILIGSIRNKSDEEYVDMLQRTAKDLGIPSSQIEFVLDAKYELVKEYLFSSSYGLNAMWNEHFGIAVVEYVASGLIPIVHASAGPYFDIVVPWDSTSLIQAKESNVDTRTGFFFKDKSDPDFKTSDKFDDLNEAFLRISKLSKDEKLRITNRGKQCVLEKFSDQKFDDDWNKAIDKISTIKSSSTSRIFLISIILSLVALGLKLTTSV